MSEYRLDVTGNLQLSDYSNIHDYMGVVGESDKFTIVVDDNSDNADILCSMLDNNNFNIISKGGYDNGKLYISAYRRK